MSVQRISVILMLLISAFVSLLSADVASTAWNSGGWKAAGAVLLFIGICALWYGTACIIDRMNNKPIGD
jgi:hypothetical protein